MTTTTPTQRPRSGQPAVPELALDAEQLAAQILRGALGVVVVLWGLDYFVNYSEWTSIGAIRRLCNMTREDGLASWVQVTQTLLTGLTAALIALAGRQRGWFLIAAFFLYLSVDDGAQVHERVGTAFDTLRERGIGPGTWFPSYAWQIVFVPVFGATGLFIFRFLWKALDRAAERARLALAIALQVFAVGLDFQEGLAPDHRLNVYAAIVRAWNFEAWADQQFGETPFDTVTHFSQSLEEGLEMISIALFWTLFVRRLSRDPAEIKILFRRG